MGSQDDCVSPDGYIRKGSYFAGMVDLCAFVSGVHLSKADNPGEFDVEKLLSVSEPVTKAVMGQHLWLEQVKAPEAEVPSDKKGASRQEINAFFDQFVKAAGAGHCATAWLEIEAMPVASAAKYNSDGVCAPVPRLSAH